MAHTALNPPAAAARAPVAIVSTSSLPGSRRCTCRSTSPGATTWPRTWRLLQALEGDTEDPVILPHARDEAHLHALELQPQHVQHVGPLDRLLDAAEATHAQLFDAARHERIGAAHAHFGAELGEAPDVRARHPRVQHVAHETHLEPGDLAVLVPDRE